MPKSLHNTTILFTRPAQQSANLCTKIKGLGGRALLFPTLEIAEIADQNQLLQQLQQLHTQEIAIFISPNAVSKALPLIRSIWQSWPASVKIAAIGSSTANSLQAAGLIVDFFPPDSFNSEALLAWPALHNIHGKKIIVFKGEGGRELLATTLRERKALVTEAIVYRRMIPVPGPSVDLLEQPIDIVVCTSNTGLQNLVEIAGPAHRSRLQNMSLLVISERMAAMAKTLGFVKPPLVADNATDNAIVKALVTWQENTWNTRNLNQQKYPQK